MRNDAAKNVEDAKYCAVCGRLISSHVRNFEERKYCSKSCRGTKLNEVDKQIEQEFIAQAIEHGSVECGKIQKLVGERLGLGGNLEVAQSEQEKSAAGNAEAIFRERVRRAARRVVVNGERDGHSFICWSHGKAAEPSFAKGEWSVKHVKK